MGFGEWFPSNNSDKSWLGLSSEFWKPEEETDIVKSFKQQGYRCGCGRKAHSWRYVREENYVEYNCIYPNCVIGAFSPDHSYMGVYMSESEGIEGGSEEFV